jgi:acyl-CoA synthetase (AMP-forming)/AMP-acid ligase II
MGGMGNVLVALTVGAGVICTNRFSVDWWRDLRALEATHCLLVPAMIEMLLAQRCLDAVPLDTLVYGASPIALGTLRSVLDLLPGVAVVSLYGQTEGSPITSLGSADHRRAAAEDPGLLATVGRPVSGLRLRIDQPDGVGVGEVLASAGHLSAANADGWLRTGDLGSIDEEGYLRLCGRRNDMVIRGGENVYPVEVEEVISRHPAVRAVGVVGVHDSRLGETLAAFVVPVDGDRPPQQRELRSFTRTALAGFKVPQYWHTVAELPLNSAGKVVRRELATLHHEQNRPR